MSLTVNLCYAGAKGSARLRQGDGGKAALPPPYARRTAASAMNTFSK